MLNTHDDPPIRQQAGRLLFRWPGDQGMHFAVVREPDGRIVRSGDLPGDADTEVAREKQPVRLYGRYWEEDESEHWANRFFEPMEW